MSNISHFTKDPNSVLDYQISWADWLGSNETISISTWTAGAGLTIDSSTNTDTTAKVWLSGGVVGMEITVTNRITTNQLRTEDQSLVFTIKER